MPRLQRDGVGSIAPVPKLSAFEQAGLAKAIPELNVRGVGRGSAHLLRAHPLPSHVQASIAKGVEFAAKWAPKA